MKKVFSLVTVIALFAVVLTSCSKYEEGPGISLLPKKARVAGEWKVDKMIVDGEEQTLTDDDKNSTIVLEKDGTGKVKANWGGASIELNLQWEFNGDKTGIRMRYEDFFEEGEWDEWPEEYSTIIRLANKEFWIQDKYTVGETEVVSETHLMQ